MRFSRCLVIDGNCQTSVCPTINPGLLSTSALCKQITNCHFFKTYRSKDPFFLCRRCGDVASCRRRSSYPYLPSAPLTFPSSTLTFPSAPLTNELTPTRRLTLPFIQPNFTVEKEQTVYPFHFLVRASHLIRFCLSKLQTNRIVRILTVRF